jgi:hypothetical protein
VFINVFGDGAMRSGVALLAPRRFRILDALAPAERRRLPFGLASRLLEQRLEPLDLAPQLGDLTFAKGAFGCRHRLPLGGPLGAELSPEFPNLAAEKVAFCGRLLRGPSSGAAQAIAFGFGLPPRRALNPQLQDEISNTSAQ